MDLNFLKSYGIDISDKFVAAETCRMADHDADTYRDIIRQVLGFDLFKPINVNDEQAPVVARYVVYAAMVTPDAVELSVAIEKAKKHMQSSCYSKPAPRVEVAVVAESNNSEEVVNDAPKKMPRGYKKQAALRLYRENQGKITERKAWIALLVDEIQDMNPGSANTYIHNIENNKAGWEV